MGLSKASESCNIDLNNKVKTENGNNGVYSPYIAEHNCPFWNIVTIIFIIVSSHVGNTFKIRQHGSKNEKKDRPKGVTACQRMVSLTIALIYGSEGRS